MSAADTTSTSKPRYHDLIDKLELSDLQKDILKQRWADQTVWHGKKSRETKKRMIQFRVLIIVGGIVLPAAAFLPGNWPLIITPVISLIVAGAAGLEAFFKDAEKHSQYRETAEILKIEGWSYFAGTGVYKDSNHEDTFEDFTRRVENIIRRDVRAYVNLVQEQIKQIHDEPSSPPESQKE